MKVSEVPQDDANLFEGKTRDVQYALDENGKYTTVKSVGWDPKNAAMQQAWDAENKKIEEARVLVMNGLKSPTFYFMHKCLMTVKLVADYTQFSRLKVKRHFKPEKFKKLTEDQLDRYVYAFGLNSKEELFKINQ